MFGTFKEEDVTVLLKDITGMIEPLSTEVREAEIQKGRHYCEMLPIEYSPTAAYADMFEKGLTLYRALTAEAVASVAQKIMRKKCGMPVLVSLARAGIPIGILIKRYIKGKYGIEIPHYTISIIRGKGIDRNAMDFILRNHASEQIQFVDGWTGKGAIQNELNKAMTDYPEVCSGLAVLSDPAYVAELCGTHDDFLIASSCLNSTVSGLLSRTFLRDDIIGKDDFHGAVYYKELIDQDVTYKFIGAVEEKFDFSDLNNDAADLPQESAIDEIRSLADEFDVKDINLIKPGIGEATRVLLRRLPWKILVQSRSDDAHLGHLYQLAKEKGVEVTEYPLKHYRACGIIKSLADT